MPVKIQIIHDGKTIDMKFLKKKMTVSEAGVVLIALEKVKKQIIDEKFGEEAKFKLDNPKED